MSRGMKEWITATLFTIGGIFACLAAVGVARMPDVFSRLHATSKSATLGVGCILLGVAIHFQDLGVTTRSVLTIAFLFMTAPIAAHFISRAAYQIGVPLWEGTIIDELRDKTAIEEE
jgi:multicomponent Na+:H+ antiporter subunit G